MQGIRIWKAAILAAARGLVVLVALCALSASAAHYYVAPGGTGDYTQANPGGDPNYCSRVHAVNPGDVIHLAAGTYVLGSTPTINGTVPNQQIFLKRGVKLIGATDDPADTVIDGNGSGRVFCCTYESEVRNVTMRNGKTTPGTGLGYGGAVCAQSDTYPNYVISNCVVDGCTATYRGGGGSHGIWYDCVIRNCSVTYPGWTTNSTAAVAFRNEGSGGGIWAGTLYRCVVTNNYAAFIGGGIAGGGGTLLSPNNSKEGLDACIAYDCTIGWNSAGFGGGCGVRSGPDNSFPAQWASRCKMVRCTIVSNTTHDVGGFFANKGGGSDGAYLTNCVVRGNQVNYYGGGVLRSVAVGCTIEDNAVLADTEANPGNGNLLDRGYGGGAHMSTLTNCVVRGNASPDGGGCSESALVGCVVSNNVATVHNGGGLYAGTSLNCVVAFNQATAAGTADTANARGGGICKGYHQGDLVYSNLFVNGAAVTAAKGGTDITIVNCTIYDNPTVNNQNQNGFNSGYATNCLIYGHANTDIYNCRALVNCAWKEDMVTHNQSDPTLASVTNNACMRGRSFNPKFVTNPGPGECPFSLTPSSPCVDAGVAHPWMAGAKDILGNDRIFKSTAKVDIGALESFWTLGVTIIFR